MADALDVDDDTLQAVRNLWLTDTETLPAIVTEPPHAGRLKTGQGETYAHLACEQGPDENQRMTGNVRHDFRKVTISVWGKKAAVTEAIAAVKALFNIKLGDDGERTLTLPSGARFLQWWPLGDGTLKQDPDTKAGYDVWIGEVVGRVWTVRVD